MIAYLLALVTTLTTLTTLTALFSCDPALTALFTPLRPSVGRYEVCTTTDPLVDVAAAGPHYDYGPTELLEAPDAFGAAGRYDRAALARLYAGKRVRVARGWIEYVDRFESVTLLSPYPDATLTRLLPGTMVIRWTTAVRR
jgi:hypothetical protein